MSDPNGYSFPGDPYILMATELKKRTVDRSIEVLGRIALVKKMKVTGERHKTAYQINLEMLGRDLAAEFGAAFMAAQRKKSVSETGCEQDEHDCEDEVSVSETQKSVSETSFSVSETKPLQPHSRGTAIEPSGNLLADSAETVQPPSAADGESPSQPERRAKATAKAKAPDQGKSKSNGKGKPEADPRHTPFRLAVMTYAKFKGVLFVWDGSEARALTTLLRSAPELTLQVFQACLSNRAKSVGTPHGERPRLWLPHVLRYQQGPLNQFGKTMTEARHGNGNGAFKGKTESSIDAAKQAVAIIRGRQAGGYYGAAGEAGSETPGEAGTGRLLSAG
jgi:hypothetical protein